MKVNPVIIIYLLAQQYTLHPMERTRLPSGYTHYTRLTSGYTHNKFQINTIQDIPKLSLANIRPCFDILPEKQYNTLLSTENRNNIPLAESLTFSIARLPQEITLNILTSMMDGDKVSAEWFYKAPLWYAQTRYHRAKEMLQKTLLPKQRLAVLFRSPVDEQKKIMGIVTPTVLSRLIGPAIFIDKENEVIVKSFDEEIQNNFFVGEDIRVMESNGTEQCCHASMLLGFTGLLFGGGISILICSLRPSIFFAHCANHNLTPFQQENCFDRTDFNITAISISSIITLNCIVAWAGCNQYFRQNARKIEI